MASDSNSGYGLRSRKKMVPYIPDTCSDQYKTKTSNMHANGSLDGARVKPEECELQEIKPETEIVKLINVPNTGAEEEETLFDQTSDTQPLLGRELSGDDEVKIETENIKTIVEKSESSFSIALQVFFPYIIAGFGTVGAGMVLDVVQKVTEVYSVGPPLGTFPTHWEVFQTVSEVFILVPSLLGLKGNLEMTLASRLSTQAHLGKMEDPGEKWKMIGGNLALVQAQAIVVGFLASMVAMIMGWIPEGKFNIHHGLLLCASSMLTAAVASFILGSIMVLVIVVSRKLKINPDNVATPIAASLGDLTTLSLLAAVSLVLYKAIGKQLWLAPTIIGIFVLLAPLWVYISVKNKYTNHVIYQGWTPVLSAMVISSIGGLILDYTVGNYHGIAVFQPVINGVGGNLVAVQASRITTSLHLVSKPGKLPTNALNGCPNAFGAFCGKGMNARAARVLMALVIPGHLIFMYTISYMKAGHTSITPLFALVYLTAAVLQVLILLYLAHWMVHFVWKLGDDPDNVAIPYLTAIGDLLGTAFLAIAFHILYLMGDKDADVGD